MYPPRDEQRLAAEIRAAAESSVGPDVDLPNVHPLGLRYRALQSPPTHAFHLPGGMTEIVEAVVPRHSRNLVL